MDIKVIVPPKGEKGYFSAANEFIKYYGEITGKKLSVSEIDDGIGNLIIIGSDAVNNVLSELILSGQAEELRLRAGSDDYLVKSFEFSGRRALVLAGGSVRATFYAVYDFFESKASCKYYWDGDSVPKNGSIDLFSCDMFRSSDFEYRGIRYFAHRGLHRFQAEHWGFEDWKREIDFLLKKRLNLFMLRIGFDDLFQRAFPDVVGYPDANCLDEYNYGEGYDDRRPFWSLEYRGRLRKKVLDYAFERGLTHPEDTGTVTHWYSRTPRSFLDSVKPKLFKQATEGYGSDTGLVWDIREEENFKNYLKLTETHIGIYGKAELFHMIGFAERLFSDDKRHNAYMKKLVYKKFLQYLRENYPTAKCLIASWDLWIRYSNDEVKELLKEFDKNQVILFDYTSDTSGSVNFTQWEVIEKFPYIFGLFHAYQSNSDLMGYYPLTTARMKTAKADPMCKGIVLWPELSHSDILMLEFFTANSWSRETVTVDECIQSLCLGRYGQVKEMRDIWQKFLSVVRLMHWSMEETPETVIYFYFDMLWQYIPYIAEGRKKEDFYRGADINAAKNSTADALSVLDGIRSLNVFESGNRFLTRDVFDMIKTVLGRYLHFALIAEAECVCRAREGESLTDKIEAYAKICGELLALLAEILGMHEDYSLYCSLERLKEENPVYEGFEETLKNNAANIYSRGNVYEIVKELYIYEMKTAQEYILKGIKNNFNFAKIDDLEDKKKETLDRFMKKPLKDMRAEAVKKDSLEQILTDGAACIKRLEALWS